MVEEAAQRPVHAVVLGARRGAEVDGVEHELAQPQHRPADLVGLGDVAALARAGDDVAHQGVDPRRAGLPEQLDLRRRQVVLGEDPGADRVVDVVVDVGDPVDQSHHPTLERRRLAGAGVVEDPVADLLGQVQSLALALELVDDPSEWRLCLNPSRPALAHRPVERLLADVAERRVAEVVPEPDRLGQVLVQGQRPGDGPGDEAGLERVREPSPVVVALGGDEHLRLVLQPPERLRVGDPVAIALKRRPHLAVGLGDRPIRGIRARRRRPEVLPLPALDALPQALIDRSARLVQSGLSIRRASSPSRGSGLSRITR